MRCQVSTLLFNCPLADGFAADEWLESKGDDRKRDNAGIGGRDHFPEKPFAIQGSIQLEM
jgi:hypothetical protein